MSEFRAGQQLYYVANRNGGDHSQWIAIEKVGREWLTMKGGRRIAKGDLKAEGKGYSSPGRCYVTQEEYINGARCQKLYDHMRTRIPSFVGQITEPEIRSAAKLLRVSLEGVTLPEFPVKAEGPVLDRNKIPVTPQSPPGVEDET